MIELRTLGTLDIRAESGRDLTPILAQPKRLVLLTYLTLTSANGRPRRDTILGLFWPELDQRHAQGALRQAVWFLRRALGEGVLAGRVVEELSVSQQALSCDAVLFERACQSGDAEAGLGLYRGDFLPGFYVADAAPELNQWIEDERVRLRRRAGRAAWWLAEQAEASGQGSAAAEWARRAVSFAPDDEAQVRRLIAVLDRVADPEGALEVYQDFARRRRWDGDDGPSAEIRALLTAARSRPRRGPLVTVSAPRTDQPPVHVSQDGPSPSVPEGAGATHRRVRRTLAVAVAATMLAAGGYFVAFRAQRTVALVPERVVVVPFENRTGDAALDPVGDMAADWLTRGLMQTGVVDVVDARMTQGLGHAVVLTGVALVRALAEEAEAGTVVWGTLYREGETLVFQAQITNPRTGRPLRVIDPVEAAVGEPLAAVDELRRRVMASVAMAIEPQLESWTASASQPPTFESYRAFLAGLDLYLRGPVTDREALDLFIRAAALDPTFTLPLAYVAFSYRILGDCVRADSMWAMLWPERDRLAPFDRAHLETMHAMCVGDWRASLASARRTAEQAPASDYLSWRYAFHALRNNRPQEARVALEKLEPGRGWLRGRTEYWVNLGEALHLLGEYENERQAARRARAQYPEVWSLRGLELWALAAMGRVREVEARVDTILQSVPDVHDAPLQLVEGAALELRAHDHLEAAQDVAARGLKWYDAHPGAARESEEARARWGRLLRLAGRWLEGEAVFSALAAKYPANLHYAGQLGVFAALRGDRAGTARIDSSLARSFGSYLIGTQTVWRARIAAALGERDRAVTLLREAYDQGQPFAISSDAVPLWTPVRGHPFAGGSHAVPEWDAIRDHPGFLELFRPKG